MEYKIISDSSSNVFSLPGADFASVPLKINAGGREYVDTPDLDVDGMIADLQQYRGRSGSSCPNVFDWTAAFGDAEGVFAVTISSNLSGSYSSAVQAGEEYIKAHPGRRFHVFDSLTAGPEMQLILERIREGVQAGKDFDAIVGDVEEYRRHTYTLFCLKSMLNLARNGRVKPAVAKIAGVLGIQVVGDASPQGTLQMLHKCRGERRALRSIISEMEGNGLSDGRVIISHCQNPEAAGRLRENILEEHPGCEVEINACTALCSFYAESGGLIIGYEGK